MSVKIVAWNRPAYSVVTVWKDVRTNWSTVADTSNTVLWSQLCERMRAKVATMGDERAVLDFDNARRDLLPFRNATIRVGAGDHALTISIECL